MSYEVTYSTQATKSIASLPRDVQRRVLARAGRLSANPRPPGCVKLTGSDDYRIRVGDYRILYTIHDGRLVVLVIDVGNRRDVYRRR